MQNRRSGMSQTLATLALLAAFLRAFIPAGYMLTPTADHTFVVTLCSGHGPVQAVVDLDGGTDHDGAQPSAPKKSSVDAPCVFAAAATPVLPQIAVSAPTPSLANGVGIARPVALSPGRGLAAPPPWSTGPPLHV